MVSGDRVPLKQDATLLALMSQDRMEAPPPHEAREGRGHALEPQEGVRPANTWAPGWQNCFGKPALQNVLCAASRCGLVCPGHGHSLGWAWRGHPHLPST